jgi:hypothetical protein
LGLQLVGPDGKLVRGGRLTHPLHRAFINIHARTHARTDTRGYGWPVWQLRTILADKEVILCGGAINSPQVRRRRGLLLRSSRCCSRAAAAAECSIDRFQLLMLSGVGDAADLAEVRLRHR